MDIKTFQIMKIQQYQWFKSRDEWRMLILHKISEIKDDNDNGPFELLQLNIFLQKIQINLHWNERDYSSKYLKYSVQYWSYSRKSVIVIEGSRYIFGNSLRYLFIQRLFEKYYNFFWKFSTDFKIHLNPSFGHPCPNVQHGSHRV